MSVTPKLRKRFNRAAIAGTLLFGLICAGCGAPNLRTDQRQERDAIIQQLEQAYPNSPRIRAILEDQKTYTASTTGEEFLRAQGIRLQLSADGLPDGAVIRLFKDHWQINPFVSEDTQALAVYWALEYVQGQARDGLPYGDGESFAIISRLLAPVGNVPTSMPRGCPGRLPPSHA